MDTDDSGKFDGYYAVMCAVWADVNDAVWRRETENTTRALDRAVDNGVRREASMGVFNAVGVVTGAPQRNISRMVNTELKLEGS
ncbi:MAG: hypothetical protein LBT97_03180 [Planctomycetota bacterium]|jgi:hypothetical protein|nr:hypothetical protein [Planctomycetota bacterium]